MTIRGHAVRGDIITDQSDQNSHLIIQTVHTPPPHPTPSHREKVIYQVLFFVCPLWICKNPLTLRDCKSTRSAQSVEDNVETQLNKL